MFDLIWQTLTYLTDSEVQCANSMNTTDANRVQIYIYSISSDMARNDASADLFQVFELAGDFFRHFNFLQIVVADLVLEPVNQSIQ